MRISQFINSINQIRCAEHIKLFPAYLHHCAWLFRRLIKRFPVELKISQSKLIVNEPNGVAALINSMGMYDFNNMNLIKRFLERYEGSVFFDIGANIGSYTLVASETAKAEVVAFEPHPKTFQQLAHNIHLNARANVALINAAVSDKNGKLKLSDQKPQLSSINKVLEDKDSEFKTGLLVKSITLDQVCNEMNLYPTIVKIDTEGHEYNVIKGFQSFIHLAAILMIEQGDQQDIRTYLQTSGFIGPFYFHVFKSGFLPIPQKRQEDTIFINCNSLNRIKLMKFHVR